MWLYDSTTVLHRNVRPYGWRLSQLGAVFVDDLPHGTNVDPLVRYCSEQAILYPDTQDKVFAYGSASQKGDVNGNVAGRIRTETSEAGTRSIRYDRHGNETQIAMAFHRMREPHLGDYVSTIGYAFDSFGRPLKVRFPGANEESITYAYDAGGNVQSVFGQGRKINAQHPDEPLHSDYVMHVGYDEYGQRVRTIAGNFVETKYAYRPATRRLGGIDSDYRDDVDRINNRPAHPMQRMRYAYDLVGNVTNVRNDAPFISGSSAVTIGTTSHSYTYDRLYQLRTAAGLMQDDSNERQRYSFEQRYDEVGNITLKDQHAFRQVPNGGSSWRDDYEIREQSYKSTYEYDGAQPHAPSQIEERLPAESLDFARAFQYDPSGNQIESVYRGSDRRLITWNEDDQIKTVVKNGQELNRSLYDARGQKAVHLHRVSGMEETAYLGPHLTFRDGKYLTKHVFVGGERVASKMDPDWFQEPPTLYFHTDHLGSANYVTSDRQALVQHDEYMPSGEVWQNATDSRYELARRFLFTGKELDIHTGLYDFGARSYDARQGQWLSPDPAFDGLNLYGYVHNNPVNLVDPTGLSAAVSRDNPIPVSDTVLQEGQQFFQASNAGEAGFQDAASFDANSADSPVYEASSKGLDPATAKAIGSMKSESAGFKDPFVAAGESSLGDKSLQAGMMAGAAMTGSDIRTDGSGSSMGIPNGKCSSCEGGRGYQAAFIGLTIGALVGGSAMQGYRAIAATRSELTMVSSWADVGTVPDLNPGRWVMRGLPTRTNYWLSGLPGPKWLGGLRFQGSRSSPGNYIVDAVPRSSLRWPSGGPAGMERMKGLFGQRTIGGP